jgi:hypothetical protein
MQQVATAIVYRENRFNQSLQSAGPPRDRHARKQRRQIQLAVDPEPCMLAIISEIGTRSLNEDNAATIVTMIVKIDRLGRGGVNEQAILKVALSKVLLLRSLPPFQLVKSAIKSWRC